MIEGVRIKLKPIEHEDLQILNKWKNDEEIFKYLGGGFQPISIDEQREWMEQLIKNTDKTKRFIIINENERKIGFIGIYNISSIHQTCNLGLYIGEKDEWGKGYAKEAYLALEHFAKNYLNIRKINLDVVEENEIAVKLYEKLGFNICGKYSKERYINGEYKDLIIMEKFI